MVLTAGDHGALLLNRGRYYCLKVSQGLFRAQQMKCFSLIQCLCMYNLLCFRCCLSVSQQRCSLAVPVSALRAVLFMQGGWASPWLNVTALHSSSVLTAPGQALSNTLFSLGFVCTGAAPASAPSCQDGISEATRWWLGLGDCCGFLLHPVPVLWITAGGGSLVFRVAGCFWRRERQDCLGWITGQWNWIACQ